MDTATHDDAYLVVTSGDGESLKRFFFFFFFFFFRTYSER